jgi:acetyl-CoA/propionyl-CoA carboxylase biotin carboxyl carrier protein
VIPPPQVVTPGDAADDTKPLETIVEVNGRRLSVAIHGGIAVGTPAAAAVNGNGRAGRRAGSGKKKAGGGDLLESPIQGTVIRLNVAPGQAVSQGELICVVEAMKMENEIVAHKPGTIATLHIAKGAAVQIGGAIADIKD